MSANSQKSVSSGWALRVGAIILWTFLVVAGYFWAHKPFDIAIVAGLGRSLLSIIAWLAVSCLGAALGHRLLLKDVSTAEAPFTRLALATGVGLGFLSLLLLGLGLVGLFRPWAAGLLLLILVGFLRRDVGDVLGDVRALRLPQPENRLQRWLRAYGAASLLLTFLLALAPTTAWDSLAYHLVGPELFVAAGRIVHPIDIPQLGFPLLGQMHFALGMLLQLGDGPAALFHFGYGLMALAVTVTLTQRAFGRSAAWFAGALLLSVPSLLTVMSWPYVDITLLFYATAAFYTFLGWRHAHLAGMQEQRWLLLLGIFCGFSVSVKYTAVFIPISIGLSIAWVTRRQSLWALARRLALIGGPALALVSPYLLKNWLTTGNPVYPFFFDNGIFLDEWRLWWYDRPGTGLLTTAPWRLPIVPLEITILGTEGSNFYDATIGPILLGGLGMLPFVWRTFSSEEKALSGHILLFIVINYLPWLGGVARSRLLLQARLLFFIFGVTAALGGVALARLPALRRPQFDVNWLVQVLAVLSLGLILFSKTLEFLKINPLPVVAGVESADSYRRRRLGAYEAAMDAVNQLPAGSKVDFLWEPRSYGCHVECWPDLNLDRYLHYTHYYGFDADELADFWRRESYTHVLLHQAGLDFVWENRRELDQITEQDWDTLQALRERHLTPVTEWEGAYTLFQVGEPE